MENLIDVLKFNKSGLYVVDEGDTLDSIAKKFNTTERVIYVDNSLDKEICKGNVLFIRCYSNIYEVKVEDTLQSISKSCNISVEELKRINYIEYIYPTQKLIIDKY